MFIPSQKDIAAIYLLPAIVNNKQISTISKNSLSILDKELQNYLKQIIKDK